MTYEIYRLIFFIALALCGVMAIVSVLLFFLLKIPRVVGDLTGRTARKAIENIRKQNEESGDKTYKSSAVNMQRGKLTDKISPSGRIVPRAETPFGTGIITEQLADKPGAAETTVLSAAETTVLDAASETTVLSPEYGETSVLDTPMMPSQPEPVPTQEFVIEYEITFVHTSEIIA